MANAWGRAFGGDTGAWGVSWGSSPVATGAGRGAGHKKRIYIFPDGTMGYCNAAEAAAIADEMNLHVPASVKPEAPKVVTQRTRKAVPRQQLIDFIRTQPLPDTATARREIARLLRRLRENERRMRELEEEEIALLITLLH